MILGRSVSFGVFVALLVLGFLVVHVALGHGRAAPDFIAIAVLLAARRLNAPQAGLLALALGLVADALALSAFGATGVALVVVGWLGTRTRDLFEGGSYAFTAIYLFTGKWLIDALRLLIAPAARAAEAQGGLWTVLPLSALYTALAGVLALALYRWSTGERAGR